MASDAHLLPGCDALAAWRDDLLSGKPPVRYPAGSGGLARLELGPGLVTLLGGAPGAGKTAFALQLLVDALRLTPTLRAAVCNVEMPPAVLLDRQLSRLSGVDLDRIRKRQLGPEHAERISRGLATLEQVGERLAFVRPPFDLGTVAAAADAFGAELLLLDYLQRIPPPGEHTDGRAAVNATMSHLRRFADEGHMAVLAISAVGRGRDSRGRSTYAGDALSLASFRESGELEYGCDDAFLLVPDGEDSSSVALRHLKARHGETRDISLAFDGKHQRFAAEGTEPPARHAEMRAALAGLWQRTAPAAEDSEDAP